MTIVFIINCFLEAEEVKLFNILTPHGKSSGFLF